MAAFSRLQLAKALIEYDNDDLDPDAPHINAYDSAIFAHLRRNKHRSSMVNRSSDYLGVPLPSEAASHGGRVSDQDRKSRASSDALHNPFGRDSTYGDLDLKDDDIEVDLASWGLDALVPKDKSSRRSKSKSGVLKNPPPQLVPPRQGDPHRRLEGNRSVSLGNIDMFVEGASRVADSRQLGPRRHSIGDPLDAARLGSSSFVDPEQVDSNPTPSGAHPPHSIPFPSSLSIRAPSPPQGSRSDIHSSQFDQPTGFVNPFEIQPPSPDRASKFDPKTTRSRTLSQGTTGLMEPPQNLERQRVPENRTRTISVGTQHTQMLLGDDEIPSGSAAQPAHERLYSRAELMRPKLLVMPSPLQSASPPSQPEPTPSLSREGFMLSSDGRPLPPGARTTSRRASTALSAFGLPGGSDDPLSPDAFTPNPRTSLTLSQLTFRNTLMVGGARDVAYSDIDARVQRATEEGEQIIIDPEPQEVLPVVIPEAPPQNRSRPPGKLLGRSLIDDLEARKAEMKGKQRTFTGDQRPSMMARSPTTLIDPESLKQRPAPQISTASGNAVNLARRNSKGKPLINFDDEIPGARNTLLNVNSQQRGGNAKSVFGVDTIWERELIKLREIEEQERIEEDERKKREATEPGKNKNKNKGKRKEKDKTRGIEVLSNDSRAIPDELGLSVPPVLPEIRKYSTPRRAPLPPEEDDEHEGSDTGSDMPQQTTHHTSGWHVGSSDEENEPRQKAINNPQHTARQHLPPRADESDSEEDVPLVATIGRAVERAQGRMREESSDSEEEKPLSALIDAKLKAYPKSPETTPASFLRPGASGLQSDDEDDKPLGLRASRVLPSSSAPQCDDDDDNKPLALHPDHFRRTQYAAMAQQQHFMMQAAQMHQSMVFGNPALMGSGFFGPPMPPPMVPLQMAPSVTDATKFGRVDKWRHDVAVEGLPPS